MAPVLFLFLMQAMAGGEASEVERTKSEIDLPHFHHIEKVSGVWLLRQSWKMKGKLFELYYPLYVDNEAFIFMKQRDMIKASHIVLKIPSCSICTAPDTI